MKHVAVMAKDILIEAKRLIENPVQWLQGNGCDAQGRLCASYAILRAFVPEDRWGTIDPHSTQRMYAAQALEKVIGPAEIYEWNDNRRRTHQQVMRAFDRAIRTVGC